MTKKSSKKQLRPEDLQSPLIIFLYTSVYDAHAKLQQLQYYTIIYSQFNDIIGGCDMPKADKYPQIVMSLLS